MSNYIQSIDFSDKDALPTGNPAKLGRGADIDTELALIAAAIATKEDTANKGASSGYAGLDSSGDVPRAQLPTPTAYEDEANVFTANQEIEGTSPALLWDETDAAANERSWIARMSGGFWALSTATDAAPSTPVNNAILIDRTGTTVDSIAFTSTALTWNGATLFTTANDGTGTGLDSDLLDGQHGSFYQSASNLNAGSIPDARVPSSAVTQHQAALAINNSQTTSDINNQTGSFSVASSMDGDTVVCDSGSTITVTVGSNALGGAGKSAYFIRRGAGAVTFSASGVTIRSPGGGVSITTQQGGAALIQIDSTNFDLKGNV